MIMKLGSLSDSVNKICVKRRLAEKSRWRHIPLAIKPRYLGNDAPQMKSYYGTLPGSHGRSFRIRQVKLPESTPGGKITMTSYSACNKTLISRKPYIADKKLLWTTIRKSWSLLQNPSWKITWSGGLTMTSYPVVKKTSLSRNPCIPNKTLIWNVIMKSWPLFQNLSRKCACSAPWRRTDDDVTSGLQ